MTRMPFDRLETVRGDVVDLALPGAVVHVMLRRFVGCPVCSLHLHGYGERIEEVRAAGIRTLAVFRSPVAALAAYQDEVPMELVADPDGQLYRLAGVGRSPFAVLPRAIGAATRGLSVRSKARSAPGLQAFGLVADFLVAPDGVVVALRRGRHADDQWSVDELLEHARAAGFVPAPRRDQRMRTSPR